MKKTKTLILTLFLTFLFFANFTSSFTAEEMWAYDYAYKNSITTMNSISLADMWWNLIRIAMAKMLSNYAINILWLTPDTGKICYFPDVPEYLDNQYDHGVTKSCQLGLMWIGISNFYPYLKVTRAEFGTVLSRALNANNPTKISLLNNAIPYYSDHLKFLNAEWIMRNISNPDVFELRWWVMLMLMRADENYEQNSNRTGCISDEFDWRLTVCNISNASWYPCRQDWENSLYCRHIVSIESWAFEKFMDLKKLTILWKWTSPYNTLSYLDEITKLTDLEELEITHNNISDISGLSWLVKLKKLNLNNNYISDISVLWNLTNLKELSLNFNYVSDISALRNLTWLTYLSIDQSFWNRKISDISVLENLTNLESLNLSSQSISDISPLRNNIKLNTLYLGHNNISYIWVLWDLTDLKMLFLWQNNISDISALANLKKLNYLWLDVNKISDISALSWLTKLIHLALNTNNISDVSPLSGLYNLWNLYLWENVISDISPLENLTKLDQLYIWKNPINYSVYPWLNNIRDVSTVY